MAAHVAAIFVIYNSPVMQEVVPNAVAMAVRILMSICTAHFTDSFFIQTPSLLHILVEDIQSFSTSPVATLGGGWLHLSAEG